MWPATRVPLLPRKASATSPSPRRPARPRPPRSRRAATAAPPRRPPQRATAPAEVWAVGDGGYPTAAAHAVAEQIRRARPDRVLYLGDVYERGTLKESTAHFTRVYERLLKRMAPTPGNHEWPQHRSGYD